MRNPSPACFEFPLTDILLHRRLELFEEPFRFRIPDCDCDCDPESAGADICLAVTLGVLNDDVEVLDRRNLPNPNLRVRDKF